MAWVVSHSETATVGEMNRGVNGNETVAHVGWCRAGLHGDETVAYAVSFPDLLAAKSGTAILLSCCPHVIMYRLCSIYMYSPIHCCTNCKTYPVITFG